MGGRGGVEPVSFHNIFSNVGDPIAEILRPYLLRDDLGGLSAAEEQFLRAPDGRGFAENSGVRAESEGAHAEL